MTQPAQLPEPLFVEEDFEAGERVRVHKGECVLFERENGVGNCFLILDGAVDVRLLMAGGNETLLYTLHAGELVGELSLFLQERTATVIAAENSSLLLIRPTIFWQSYQREDFRKRITSLFLSRYLRTHDVVCRLGQPSVAMRICRYLLSLPQWREHTEASIVVELPGREQMAHLLSCQRETVSRSLRKLQVLGLLEQESRQRYRLHREKLALFLDEAR